MLQLGIIQLVILILYSACYKVFGRYRINFHPYGVSGRQSSAVFFFFVKKNIPLKKQLKNVPVKIKDIP